MSKGKYQVKFYSKRGLEYLHTLPVYLLELWYLHEISHISIVNPEFIGTLVYEIKWFGESSLWGGKEPKQITKFMKNKNKKKQKKKNNKKERISLNTQK